jgi:hypothetical protein
MPGNRAEMLRDVFLISNANIKGGVFAHELLIEGENIKVEKAIYAEKSIIFKESNKNKKGSITNEFGSTVVASDSILMNSEYSKSRFKSDLYCNKLNIVNAIVYGNIFANNAIIRNSIVLGGIYCKNSLEISNSVYSTFRANSVNLGENLFQLLPIALSETPITLEHKIKVITFLNIYRSLKNTELSGVIELDEDDIFHVDENFLSQDGKQEKGAVKPLYCLSVAERILDTEKIIEHFEFNKKFVETIALNSHIKKNSKSKELNKPIEDLEKYLWDILKGKGKISNIEARESVEAIFDRIKDKKD